MFSVIQILATQLLISTAYTGTYARNIWNHHYHSSFSYNHRECPVGYQCLPASKCPITATDHEALGCCSHWNDETLVCCLLQSDSDYPNEILYPKPTHYPSIYREAPTTNRWHKRTPSPEATTPPYYWNQENQWHQSTSSFETTRNSYWDKGNKWHRSTPNLETTPTPYWSRDKQWHRTISSSRATPKPSWDKENRWHRSTRNYKTTSAPNWNNDSPWQQTASSFKTKSTLDWHQSTPDLNMASKPYWKNNDRWQTTTPSPERTPTHHWRQWTSSHKTTSTLRWHNDNQWHRSPSTSSWENDSSNPRNNVGHENSRPTPISAYGETIKKAFNASHSQNPVNTPPNNAWWTSRIDDFSRMSSNSYTIDPRIIFPTEETKWAAKTPKDWTTSPKYRTKSTERNTYGQTSTGRKIINLTRPIQSSTTTRSPPNTRNSGKVTLSLRPSKTTESSFKTTQRSVSRPQRTTPMPDINAENCGVRDPNSPSRNQGNRNRQRNRGRETFQRVVGGREVEPFSWPWVVALYSVNPSGGFRFLCAGSLISESYILTASHVFTAQNTRYVAMLGTHNNEDALAAHDVATVTRHPLYQNRFYYHDIALLRLQRPVALRPGMVAPVCLPSPTAPLFTDGELEGKTSTVVGWGDDSFGGKSSKVLREASFPIVSRTRCNASYVRVASNRFPKGITEDMLCAGEPRGGKDACQGDSGGPLTTLVDGRYVQVGIVSFGYRCGDKEYPGVYTKVAPYLAWIAETTNTRDSYDYEYRG